MTAAVYDTPSHLLQEAHILFHGVRYLVSLRSSPGTPARPPALIVSARALDGADGGAHWGCSFSAAEVEQMSAKTGEFQPFGAMERMLARSLAHAHGHAPPPPAADGSGAELEHSHRIPWRHGKHFDTLTLDLLTYEQLDALKTRRNGAAAGAGGGGAESAPTPRSQARRSLNKRYLILTLSSAAQPDERVHYPLPLPFLAMSKQHDPTLPPPQPLTAANLAGNGTNGSATRPMDVTALRQQIANLTHNIQNGQQQQRTRQMRHSASAIDTRARSRSRSGSRSPSLSPPRRAPVPRGSVAAARADRLTIENEQLRAEVRELRAMALPAPSPLAAHAPRSGAPPRRQGLHYIRGEDEAPEIEVDVDVDEGGPALRGASGALTLEGLAAHAASRTIEASEELIASLQRQLDEARGAARFEADVAAKRVHSLEAENRSLRRSEAAANRRLAESEAALRALTIESERLKAKVEEFVVTTRRSGGGGGAGSAASSARGGVAAASPTRGRGRSSSPVPNRTNAAGSFPPLRGGSQSPSGRPARPPSPYLQSQRDRRSAALEHSGRNSPARSRNASPVPSGRSTPTGARSESPSGRPPRPAFVVPPLPVGRVRSRSSSPAMRSSSPGGGNPGADSDASPSRQPRAPLDLSYRQWSVDRGRASSPLRRFDPSMYVERKRALEAEKSAAMRARNEAEIARVTTPTALASSVLPRRRGSSPGRSPSPSPSPSPSSGASVPRRRAPMSLSASTPSLGFVDSPGRAARSPAERPSVYVGRGGHDRARSLRFPLDQRDSSPAAGARRRPGSAAVAGRSRSPSLGRSLSLSGADAFGGSGGRMQLRAPPSDGDDGIIFSSTSPSNRPDLDSLARSGRAAFREARTRELLLQQEQERRGRGEQRQAATISDAELRVLTHSDEEDADANGDDDDPFASYSSDGDGDRKPRKLEPNIPELGSFDVEEDEEPTPRNPRQVGALTARLAKLQTLLAAEKAN